MSSLISTLSFHHFTFLIAAVYSEGVNGVYRQVSKEEKILLSTDKTGKKLPTSNIKMNLDLPQFSKDRKFDIRQSNEILTEKLLVDHLPPAPLFKPSTIIDVHSPMHLKSFNNDAIPVNST